MTRKLASLAIIGLTVAVVCLSLGWTLGGWDPAAHASWRRSWAGGCGRGAPGWLFGAHDANSVTDKSSADAAGPNVVTLAFEPTDSVEIDLPASVSYQPGAKAEAVVSGDPAVIRHVVITGGRLGFDSDVDCSDMGRLTVRLTGPAVTDWAIHGSSDLALSGLDQKALHLRVSGSAHVVANGAAEEVGLKLSGSGDIELQGLMAKSADVAVSGSGKVQLAAKDEADINISGSAVVALHGRPARLRSHISGSGSIEDAP
jgi:hypothetical protein